MRARLCLCTVFACLFGVAEVNAQVSVRFGYRGRSLSVFGAFGRPCGFYSPYYGYYGAPFGVVQNRVSVQVITPPPVVVPSSPFPLYPVPEEEPIDVSGVDLDLVTIDGEPIKQRPDFEKPRPAPAKPQPKPLPPNVPQNNPIDESKRLTKLGEQSFRQQGYGLAAFYFRRAIDAVPEARRYFLLAQARFATGKFRKAVDAIEEGLLRQPAWPKTKFNPRDELYGANKADFDDHLRRLEDAVQRRPKNPDYLFLLAYELWFDGRRGDAVRYFRRVRPLVANKMFVDVFLK